MKDLLAAEWLKLRTTRLLAGIAPAAVAISAAAVAGATLSADRAGVDLTDTEGVRRALHVSGTGALVVLVLGIVMAAGEFRSQTATDTFLTTPRRGRVVVAKMAVAAVVGAGIGFLGAATCLATAVLLYRREGVAFPGESREVWFTLGGAVVYAATFALIGVAVGSVVRNQTAAVVGAIGWVLVVEQVLITAAASPLTRWLPAAAGQAIVRTPSPGLLSPPAGVAVILAYGVAIGLAGIVVTSRRDA